MSFTTHLLILIVYQYICCSRRDLRNLKVFFDSSKFKIRDILKFKVWKKSWCSTGKNKNMSFTTHLLILIVYQYMCCSRRDLRNLKVFLGHLKLGIFLNFKVCEKSWCQKTNGSTRKI